MRSMEFICSLGSAVCQMVNRYVLNRECLPAVGYGKLRQLSVAFGGRDLRTVYLGNLAGSRIASFRSPVAGVRPLHWNYCAAILE